MKTALKAWYTAAGIGVSKGKAVLPWGSPSNIPILNKQTLC
jgi:hypothetical protein